MNSLIVSRFGQNECNVMQQRRAGCRDDGYCHLCWGGGMHPRCYWLLQTPINTVPSIPACFYRTISDNCFPGPAGAVTDLINHNHSHTSHSLFVPAKFIFCCDLIKDENLPIGPEMERLPPCSPPFTDANSMAPAPADRGVTESMRWLAEC